jgi:DNA-binding transcriptional ArsR family regulator
MVENIRFSEYTANRVMIPMQYTKPLREELLVFHAEICAALADTTRIALLYELAEGPKDVGTLVAALEAPQATVSRHLKVLRDRHLVSRERIGAHVIYGLSDARVIHALDLLREVMAGILNSRADLAQAMDSDAG